jgi:hypothetical protein
MFMVVVGIRLVLMDHIKVYFVVLNVINWGNMD